MSAGETKASGAFFLSLYHSNLTAIWDSLLPALDVRVIQSDGTIKKVDQTIVQIAKHYFGNIIQFAVALVASPFTFTASTIESLVVSVPSLSERVNHPKRFRHPAQVDAYHFPKDFGFSSCRLQDSAEGTFLDLSSLQGIGTGDWDEVFSREIQRVTADGAKTGPITHGITLQKGEKLEDLFVNIIDHPEKFAQFLKALGCTAYRTSLERSVMEPTSGEFSDLAIQKYQAFYNALQQQGIEPWITLHHFTNPQWFQDAGGFAKEENISGFVRYAEKMVESFPQVTNWMTFNEPGIRGLEGYVRGEHPPEHENMAEAAQVIRNLLSAHTQAYAAMKRKNSELNIGITHQWLRFLPFSGNPIEKVTAYFYTSLIHDPVFQFFKEGKLHIRIPFRANVQLRYENETKAKTTQVADFLGVQAYGYPRIKVGFTLGTRYPGAADKVKNFILPWLKIGFTAGSTCSKKDRMQYFGPPARSDDLIHVLDEAFTIPKTRIPSIGISETGRDAKGMAHGDQGISSNNDFQARGVDEILDISQKYPLTFFFWWTLKRHCEWKSGSLPHLGLSDLQYDERREAFTFGKTGETAGIQVIRERFFTMQAALREQSRKKDAA